MSRVTAKHKDDRPASRGNAVIGAGQLPSPASHRRKHPWRLARRDFRVSESSMHPVGLTWTRSHCRRTGCRWRLVRTLPRALQSFKAGLSRLGLGCRFLVTSGHAFLAAGPLQIEYTRKRNFSRRSAAASVPAAPATPHAAGCAAAPTAGMLRAPGSLHRRLLRVLRKALTTRACGGRLR